MPGLRVERLSAAFTVVVSLGCVGCAQSPNSLQPDRVGWRCGADPRVGKKDPRLSSLVAIRTRNAS